MAYQVAGYYLIRLRELILAASAKPYLYTVSPEFNDNLLGYWACFGPPTDGSRQNQDLKALFGSFQLPQQHRQQLRSWLDRHYQQGRLAWGDHFAELALAYEYRNRFFSHVPNTVIFSLSFLQSDVGQILTLLNTQGLSQAGGLFSKDWVSGQLSALPIRPGKWIGYDVIGLKPGILGLTSFLVHGLGQDIQDQFGVRLNP